MKLWEIVLIIVLLAVGLHPFVFTWAISVLVKTAMVFGSGFILGIIFHDKLGAKNSPPSA